MKSVSIPKGAVMTSRNTFVYTKYTAFINTNTCEYFYKTYDDITIKTANDLNRLLHESFQMSPHGSSAHY